MILKHKLYRIFFLIFLIESAFIFTSCSGSEGKETEDIQSKVFLLSPGELKQKINEQSLKLSSLDCEGDITIDSPEMNSAGSLTMSAFKPDSLFCRLDGPFGISIARFLITRNDFIYYNVRDNLVIKGESTPLNLGAILRIKLSFDDLLSGYTNSYFFNDTSSAGSEVSKEKENYTLKVKGASQTAGYWVNSKFFYVEKYEIYDSDGKTKLQILFSDFEKYDNVYFPSNVYITNPSEKQNLWISYGKKAFNKGRLKFKLGIPKSAKILQW